MTTIQLQPADARLAALAVVYHLGRPGSELDAGTLQPHGAGLGPLQPAIEGQLGLAVTTLEVTAYQLSRLGEALHGTVNELKQYELSEGRSVVPGFAGAFARLFPEHAAEGGGALDLASQAVLLRRRLDAAVREAAAELEAARAAEAERAAAQGAAEGDGRDGQKRSLWRRFWRRRSG